MSALRIVPARHLHLVHSQSRKVTIPKNGSSRELMSLQSQPASMYLAICGLVLVSCTSMTSSIQGSAGFEHPIGPVAMIAAIPTRARWLFILIARLICCPRSPIAPVNYREAWYNTVRQTTSGVIVRLTPPSLSQINQRGVRLGSEDEIHPDPTDTRGPRPAREDRGFLLPRVVSVVQGDAAQGCRRAGSSAPKERGLDNSPDHGPSHRSSGRKYVGPLMAERCV